MLLQIVLGCNMYGKERKYQLGYAVVLLEEDVHVDSVPTGGRTALWHTVINNNKDAVKFLIQRGAVPTFNNNGNFRSPILVAKPLSTLEIYQMLLKAKEDQSVSS
jgi:ankyrin repeat protein